MPARDVDKGVGEGPRDGSGRRAEPVVRCSILQVLREDDEPRTARSRLLSKRHGALDVGIDLVGRVELHEGDGQAHGRIVAAAEKGA